MNKPRFIPSPNFFGRNGQEIKGIVIHRMAGTFDGTIAWFQNPESQVSAHYLVSQDGGVVQMVRDQEAAWHAGYKSGTPPQVFADVANPNWVSIGIECEDRTNQDINFWTQKQLNTLVNLCKILVEKYNIPIDREHIVGHSDIDPVGKPHCPGSHFPWDEFLAYLKEPEEPSDNEANLEDLRNEILYLKEEKRVLEKELRLDIDALEETNIRLEKERDEARTEREQLKATLGEKEIVILDLTDKARVLNEKIAELTSKRDELTEVVGQLQNSEKALRALLEKLEKENKVKEVNEVEFDTNKPYIRWVQIFLWNGLSAVIPAAATYLTKDPRYLAFAPLINATAKTLIDVVKKQKTAI